MYIITLISSLARSIGHASLTQKRHIQLFAYYLKTYEDGTFSLGWFPISVIHFNPPSATVSYSGLSAHDISWYTSFFEKGSESFDS